MSDSQRPALRDPLKRLAANVDRLSVHRIWRALLPTERETALSAMLDDAAEQGGDDDARDALIALVAKERHFREKTVQTWTNAKLTAAAARCTLEHGDTIGGALRALHLSQRRPLMGAFYDHLAITHEDGVVEVTELPEPAAPAARCADAAEAILATFPADDALIFVFSLVALYPQQFSVLGDWVRDRFAMHPTALARLDASPTLRDTGEHAIPIAADAFGFTTLDRRLIITIVDSASSVHGALSEDELDDLLLELVQLNSQRHQTFFHVGFRDALFKRPLGDGIPAENAQRRAWYWAGAVTGVARKGGSSAVIELFDRDENVRQLGRSAAASAAAIECFRALCAAGRFAVASGFLSRDVVVESRPLQRELVDAATRLIRENRAPDARPMLDLAWEAYLTVRAAGGPADSRFFRELRRRRALCFRQVGETAAARELLEELAKDPDALTRAIAMADLGLIACGRRRLGELRLPGEDGELRGFLESVHPGEDYFRKAVTEGPVRPAHAQFALAVLALAERRFQEAARRLEEALVLFNQSADVYSHDGTLGLAQLYHGLSVCNCYDEAAPLAQACDNIQLGLAAGARIPRWLIKPTVDALAIMRTELASRVIASITDSADESTLDALWSPDTARLSPPLVNAFLRRAASPSRRIDDRAAEYRRVLPALLELGDTERARDALEFLEEAAGSGVGCTELLSLIDDPRNYRPVWDEARAIETKAFLLESLGRVQEAAETLEVAAHRLLALGDVESVEEASLILGHLEVLGDSARPSIERLASGVEARCRALAVEAEEVDIQPNVAVRILVVGGNEVQRKMEEDIRATVANRYPSVTLDFMHTGWSSNWSTFAGEFRRRLPGVDGVVFLSLMRTMLGRTLRRECTVPRIGCGRGGQGAIVESIRRAIPMAQSHLRRRTSPSVATSTTL
jgi:tetratricopeptide (TPR) repeat protein